MMVPRDLRYRQPLKKDNQLFALTHCYLIGSGALKDLLVPAAGGVSTVSLCRVISGITFARSTARSTSERYKFLTRRRIWMAAMMHCLNGINKNKKIPARSGGSSLLKMRRPLRSVVLATSLVPTTIVRQLLRQLLLRCSNFQRLCRSPALGTIVRGRLSTYPTCRLCAGQRHSVDRRRLDANATYCADPIGTASRFRGVPVSDYLTFASSIPTFQLDCLFEIENVTNAASASKIGNCVAPGQATVPLFVFLQELALARDRVTTHLASVMGCVLGIRPTVPLAVAL